MNGESIKIGWIGCVHASQMYLQFRNRALVAFGNEDCRRFRYEFNGSLYEILGSLYAPMGIGGT
jgi:hypothetical protein